MRLECNFAKYVQSNINWNQSGVLYTCKITSASIKKPNQEIEAIIGKHVAGKTDRDVEAIWFNETEVHYMPRGIRKIFPNLRVIWIFNCGLKEISREDLVGLENIEKLDLRNNELTTLPDDLLEGMKKLKVIRFSFNKLEFVSSQLLQPVLKNQLTYVGFLNNPTINAAFDASIVNPSGSSVDLPRLMKLIDEKCKKPPRVENQNKPTTSDKSMETFSAKLLRGLNDFWTSGRLSDFTIIVSKRKFQVHRMVLSLNSEFFEEIFKNEEDNSVAELKIEDLSAEAVEEVLRWMYTRKIPDVESSIEIFALAMKLKISDLKESAEKLISQKIDEENVIEILQLGHRYQSKELKELAFEKVKKILAQPNLNEGLIDEPEKLKKSIEIKRGYDEMIKSLNKI